MGVTEILLGVLFPILVGVGVALALSEASTAEFWVARICFVLAAIDIAGLAIYWLYAATWAVGIRLFLGSVIGTITVPAVIGSLLWVDYRSEMKKAVTTENPPTKADYAYGIALMQIQPSLDMENVGDTLEFRPILRNVAGAPLRYIVDSLSVEMPSALLKVADHPNGILPKDSVITLFPGGGFPRAAYDAIPARAVGQIAFVILYGHPDDPPSRRWSKTARIELFKQRDDQGREGVTINWIGTDEKDERYIPPTSPPNTLPPTQAPKK